MIRLTTTMIALLLAMPAAAQAKLDLTTDAGLVNAGFAARNTG